MGKAASTRYATRIFKNVSIPISDGTLLSANMAMPEAAGPFPVVLDCYSYRKDDLSAHALRQHRCLAECGCVAL